MNLIDFTIAEDFISLERGQDRFDLHNNFAFQGLAYSSTRRTLELDWRRRERPWVDPADPSALSLVFEGVDLFKVQQRDPEIPFTEDDCLDTLGFMWEDLVDKMGAFASSRPQAGCRHLAINLMSGFSLKVGAVSVRLHAPGDEPALHSNSPHVQG